MANPKPDQPQRAVLLEMNEAERLMFDELKRRVGVRNGSDLVRFAVHELARARGLAIETYEQKKSA